MIQFWTLQGTRYNDYIDWNVFDNLKFASVIEYPDEKGGKPEKDIPKEGRAIGPCEVCRQWVEDHGGLNEPLIKDAIITRHDIDLSKSNNEKEEEEKKAAKRKSRKDSSHQQNIGGYLELFI